mgnify:CR=1 FL=1
MDSWAKIGMDGFPDQLKPIAGLKLTYSNVAFCLEEGDFLDQQQGEGANKQAKYENAGKPDKVLILPRWACWALPSFSSPMARSTS